MIRPALIKRSCCGGFGCRYETVVYLLRRTLCVREKRIPIEIFNIANVQKHVRKLEIRYIFTTLRQVSSMIDLIS